MTSRWVMTLRVGSGRWTPETVGQYVDATYPTSGLAPRSVGQG